MNSRIVVDSGMNKYDYDLETDTNVSLFVLNCVINSLYERVRILNIILSKPHLKISRNNLVGILEPKFIYGLMNERDENLIKPQYNRFVVQILTDVFNQIKKNISYSRVTKDTDTEKRRFILEVTIPTLKKKIEEIERKIKGISKETFDND